MTTTIVLTRPLAQSQDLASRLEQLDYEVAVFPLLEIAQLQPNSASQLQLAATLTNLEHYAMAAFVSPNAIHAVFRHGLKWPRAVAIAVLGEGSRTALAHYGIDDSNTRIVSPVDSLHSDSENLLHRLDLPALQGRRVVIFRAQTGRELLPDALLGHGILVDKVIAYQRFAPLLSPERSAQLSQLLTCRGIWVISSSEALRTFEDMVEKSAGAAGVVKMHQVILLVSHQRIAQIAEKSGFKQVRLIGLGDENLLLALQSHL